MTIVVSGCAEAMAARLRDAGQRGARLRIVAGGTWLDAGRAVDASENLPLTGVNGIVEYTPGDLTLTARAGTTLREIREAAAVHGQWLALDPYGTEDGSIGATIATASAGPLASRFGTPRDLTLGIEFVNGMGTTIRAGGRVVKNVAGFDLTRLLTGSWGTLGVITEVTVRLHARPEREVSLALPMAAARQEMVRLRATLKRWPFVPFSCEVVNDVLGRHVGVGGAAVLFRLGGNAESVAAQRRTVASLGSASEVDAAVWTRLRAADGDSSVVIRLSRAASELDSTWTDAVTVASLHDGARLSAGPARGIVRCVVPASEATAGQVASAISGVGSRVIVERAPLSLWSAVPPTRSTESLQLRIRDAFDPRRLLNRGILGLES